MNKPELVILSPLQTQSGYGKHSVDIIRSIIKLDKYDVKLISLKWGDTPMNALVPGEDDDLLSKIIPSQLKRKPEICVFISIPNEFQPIGQYNIGITAGIEATVCPPSWIEGLNRMDLNIVSSEHAKHVFETSQFVKNDTRTHHPMGHIRVDKPIEVIFEGVDTSIYRRYNKNELDTNIITTMEHIKEDFVYLFVGHWLQGSIGNDRKDVGMMIKTFLDTFKNKQDMPALLLKTSGATFSELDKNDIINKIMEIKSSFPVTDELPNVYLLHGQLSDIEMNSLYNHDKIKCMLSFTKGEGFGRPLLEFSMSGKPIIASGWSGHIDFLDKQYSLLLPGSIVPVDKSAINDFFIEGSKWFQVDYKVASIALNSMLVNYNKYLSNSKKLMYQNKNNFSFDSMTNKLRTVFNKYIPELPFEITLKLPEEKGLTLPKLKKLNKPME